MADQWPQPNVDAAIEAVKNEDSRHCRIGKITMKAKI